ncbi:pentatricopeptide repeat-containing protein At2g03880, mitochondrial-like [Alnus glutinosa]|uniref:pentatricopeptide repeat-containing protein At2g03880, mitochondrial-like n=1 Tax=Alnus glutinosa TaxID=3517 RepID=UPI002D768D3D|nr:pentatricopeptide repeat-containing protein At2g03880, mitochondrial-like [Alnus glutinosa]XP_062149389.1 pentatricopeptide repeat-containing protein At2g03880, mitochondrial-like [Alnus glutinosa]XP_062149390.1 pentatricopeptide repeat-containing protein At2g03880, mitochondrial-like [Alnus glutinosa]
MRLMIKNCFRAEAWRSNLMECDLIALMMRSPPPGFRFQFTTKLRTSSKSPLVSVRLNCSSSAALDVVELNPTSDSDSSDTRNSPSHFHEGFQRKPRKETVRDWDNSVSSREKIEKNVRSRPLSLDGKERLRRYSGMLRTCASKGSLNEGRAIHGQVIKNGIDPDSHLWVSLVNAYAKCGSPVYARRVLDEMPERDVVSWTALIQGVVAEGFGSDGVNLFCEMKREGVRPNEFTLATGLKACAMSMDLKFATQVHAEAIKVGCFWDLFVGSTLVDLYAKCGEMELAERVFFCMPEQNAVSWNALLNGYAQVGCGKEVLNLFSRMRESEMKFSKFTLSTVLKGCATSGSLREGQAVHSVAIKVGFELDEFLGCSLVDMYSKCGLAYDALKVFKMIKDPDVVAWSAMITCLDQQGHSQEAAQLFLLMRYAGVPPNQFSFASVVSAATDLGYLQYGESIHACICKYGFENNTSVSNALITMYMKNGCPQGGARVFEAMTDHVLVSWNALLSGCHGYKICNLGPRIFYQMLVEGFMPNMYTYVSVLRSCSSLCDLGFGKQVHAHTIKNSLDGNDFVGTALVDMYAKTKCLEDADAVFNKLINRDLFTWTVIITGYAQTDQAEKAVKYFSLMQQEGVKPNEFTIASCLGGCSHIAAMETGQQLHSMAIKGGQFGDIFVSSALVDMYAKCGCLEDAEAIFQGLVFRDAVAWNTMICGYTQHGQGQKALETFWTMLDEGTIPDEVTFLGVLSACSHMGLVEEGKKQFNSLSEEFGITPTVEHYACMVDILGRAGKFDEMEHFIKKMELTPHALIWETVLGACKMHGNVEFGEKAAEKLFELKPEIDSTYILLSNILAAKGRWDDVKKVRSLMSIRGVKKEPGCSWVEINGQVHIFVSQDGSHPKIRDIYIKLEELGQKLISVGYVPKTEHVLHNVSDREKKEHLNHHSERLALAFALISPNPVKTIRIFKNLRICEDCHDVMKFISDITNREIVVRDINRFHHFKGGTCSCQDYW